MSKHLLSFEIFIWHWKRMKRMKPCLIRTQLILKIICNLKHVITSWYTVARLRIFWSTLPFDAMISGEPGLVDRVLALHTGSWGFDSHRGHMSERFSNPIDQDIRTQWALSWKNSGIRVAGGDCSVTECRRWRPPYQTGKTVHVHAKHYIHNEDGRTAPGVCGKGSVPLSHSG